MEDEVGDATCMVQEAKQEGVKLVGGDTEPSVEPEELAVAVDAEIEGEAVFVGETAADEAITVLGPEDSVTGDQLGEGLVAKNDETKGHTVSDRDKAAGEAIEVVSSDDAEPSDETYERTEAEDHEPEVEVVSLVDEAAEDAVELVSAEDDDPGDQSGEAIVLEDDEREPDGETRSFRNGTMDEVYRTTIHEGDKSAQMERPMSGMQSRIMLLPVSLLHRIPCQAVG